MKRSKDLLKLYPTMVLPIECENGCGAVIELADAYTSYKRTSDEFGENRNLEICECCAAEEGHIYEDEEEPDETPVCKRQPKRKLR